MPKKIENLFSIAWEPIYPPFHCISLSFVSHSDLWILEPGHDFIVTEDISVCINFSVIMPVLKRPFPVNECQNKYFQLSKNGLSEHYNNKFLSVCAEGGSENQKN